MPRKSRTKAPAIQLPHAELLKNDEQYKRLLELAMKDPVGLTKRIWKTQCERPGGLHDFIKIFWKYVEPDREFIDNWHIHAICDHLQAVTQGKITRLLINIPPGFA